VALALLRRRQTNAGKWADVAPPLAVVFLGAQERIVGAPFNPVGIERIAGQTQELRGEFDPCDGDAGFHPFVHGLRLTHVPVAPAFPVRARAEHGDFRGVDVGKDFFNGFEIFRIAGDA